MNFSGKIISGHGRGTKLGYPTLNLDVFSGDPPEPGVYFVLAAGQKGVMHVGPRPTFNAAASVEIHVLDTNDPQVSNSIEVEVLHNLRTTVKFDSAEALKKQIEQDIMAARKYFSSHVTET